MKSVIWLLAAFIVGGMFGFWPGLFVFALGCFFYDYSKPIERKSPQKHWMQE